MLDVIDQLDKAGVAFRSATEHFDTSTPVGRMTIQILGAFAEFERAMIIDRVINGMTRKAARGAWAIGHRPFGYDVDKATQHLALNQAEAPLVPIIFDWYANQHLGTQTIAGKLNDAGHRTKAGKPWGHTAVLTLLRNRAYLGEVFFRDTYYKAPHPPLVDPEVFDRAQALLAQRGHDLARRASNPSEYLLTGKLYCGSCGKRFVGTGAHGNRYRYQYYTCFSRSRYGTRTCAADRLPADHLDNAVLAALLDTYQHTDLFDRAVAATHHELSKVRATYQEELAAVSVQIAKAEAAIERYLDAFEAGTLSEARCGTRVEKLGATITRLHARQAELHDLIDMDTPAPTQAELDTLRAHVCDVVANGTTPVKKALIGALVHEVRVDGRTATPVFRVPTRHDGKVRTPDGSVGPGRVQAVCATSR